jgi:hypothetical protein
VKALVKAARGQSSHGATGLGAQAEVTTWPAISGRLRPFFVTGRGKRGNPPCGPAPGWVGSGAARLGVRASPSHHVHPRGSKRRGGLQGWAGEEEESYAADKWGPGVSERERKRKGRCKLGCAAERPDGLAGLGRQRLSWVGRLAPTV